MNITEAPTVYSEVSSYYECLMVEERINQLSAMVQASPQGL